MFQSNGYHMYVIDRCVNTFLNSKFVKQPEKIKEATVEKIITLPYIGYPSILFARKIQYLFKKNYHIDIKCVFNTTKVKNFFSLKWATPTAVKARVTVLPPCADETTLRQHKQTMDKFTRR